nr:MAG TPA: hypothetical protein [Caudoviricetes sp.]
MNIDNKKINSRPSGKTLYLLFIHLRELYHNAS